METIVAKLAAAWLAMYSPDGVEVRFQKNHDGDTITMGVVCTAPVVRITMAGLAGSPGMPLEVPCRNGTLPLDIRLVGIDTPELRGNCLLEKELATEAKLLVTRELRTAQRITLHNVDVVSEKWGRTLSRVEYVDPTGRIHDVAARLIIADLALPYEPNIDWCAPR